MRSCLPRMAGLERIEVTNTSMQGPVGWTGAAEEVDGDDEDDDILRRRKLLPETRRRAADLIGRQSAISCRTPVARIECSGESSEQAREQQKPPRFDLSPVIRGWVRPFSHDRIPKLVQPAVRCKKAPAEL